ncbi:unnamed protein product [Microthlaspi erraticum]|uniref:TF-B3 domain-containing protein n=1 Tax=Microthlaspi erraticum TaxID=1685480 RepID=A0A6D2KXH2_9BRAS|nr:unnamed protein product [Microthlaspi erraticum]
MDEDGDSLPRFFIKVFLSETASESMAIPLSFMELLEDPLPQTAKLQGTGGRTWTVSFTRIRERAYFTTGWSRFAEDHELVDGEFMTFVYDGYHTFEVSVFARSGVKVTRAVAKTISLSDSDSEAYEEEEEEEDTSVDETSESIYSVSSEETETEAVVGSSANPCFYTILKNRPNDLLIPSKDVRDHGLRFGQTIKFIDKEGTMVGERAKYGDDRVCFKAWDRVCRRNKLKKQDTIRCELLHTNKLVHSIRIHITRGG